MENKQLVIAAGKMYRQVDTDGVVTLVEIDRETRKDVNPLPGAPEA